MAFSVRGANEPEPEIEGRAWLKLRGWLFEPIRDVHEVTFSLWPDVDKRVGPARPVSVAHIVAVRPAVEVIANFTPADFHYIWSLALSGLLARMAAISNKSPDQAVNKFKLSVINEQLKIANDILLDQARPFESFEAFDETALPSNSDVVVVLSPDLCLDGRKGVAAHGPPLSTSSIFRPAPPRCVVCGSGRRCRRAICGAYA
jgi:hypothetical protein